MAICVFIDRAFVGYSKQCRSDTWFLEYKIQYLQGFKQKLSIQNIPNSVNILQGGIDKIIF